MRISVGLGENIAAYSGFIGQQYLEIKNTLGRELQQENIATTLLSKILTYHQTKAFQNKSMSSSIIEFVTYKKSARYIQHKRRRPSCFKKGVFNTQEGHVLKYCQASSCRFLSLFTNGEESD